jgi:selenocysteine lyase/cysteine desulfurase
MFKRVFLLLTVLSALGAVSAGTASQASGVRPLLPARTAYEIARDESFWIPIQEAWDIDRSMINLNNGGAHPAPRVAMNALHRWLDFTNGAPTTNSWGWLRPRREKLRQDIAFLFGCSPEEIAITRNVTEALEIALFGLPLKAGDEVLTTTHDYPSMKNALTQRQKRDGITVRTFDVPTTPKSMAELTDLFAKAIGPKTKMILLCHITNTVGQIYPLLDISRLARAKGIDLVVDGAHAFGHFDFKQSDIGVDIYGANLHKWIGAPIGTGFLYVKKSRIKDIWPLFSAPDPQSEDIRKFENYGTNPEPIWAAAMESIAFHNMIGPKNKEERLRYLRDYWAQGLSKVPGFRLLTAVDPAMSCGIGTFTVDGQDVSKIAAQLSEHYRIVTTGMGMPDGTKGLRITPSVYTTLHELDTFVEAVKAITAGGASR